MMSRAGLLTLVRSVLAAIPLHQLIVLAFNKKTRKHVNKIPTRILVGGQG
jgi:hypothetical protein